MTMKTIGKPNLTQKMYNYIEHHQEQDIDSVDIMSEFNMYDPALVLDVLGDLTVDGRVKRVAGYGVQYRYVTTVN